VDVAFYRVILCSRLQPKHRDVQLLGLLEQTERYLSSRSQGKKRKEGARWGGTKLTLALVTMLTEVLVGASRSFRSGTVATPSSSFSFYTVIQHDSKYSSWTRRWEGNRTGCTGVTGRLRARYHCRTWEKSNYFRKGEIQ
jgi:hypothetical protein